MDMGYYILGGPDGHTPVHVEDVLEWGEWIEKAQRDRTRIVKQEDIDPDLWISTVFLGLDYSYRKFFGDGGGEPQLFETTVFRKEPDADGLREPLDDYTQRYATWIEAEAGHKRIVEKLKAEIKL